MIPTNDPRHTNLDPEMQRSRWGGIIFRAYRHQTLRRICLALLHRLERGSMYSLTLRRILKYYHGVEVGAYSYGECTIPGAWPSGVTVGRYVSVARDVKVFLRGHPLDHLSTHPFFFNTSLGWVVNNPVPFGRLQIGHDSWLGARCIITSKCTRIGIGAVIGAGAVVTKDVPDFAVVAGTPARIIKYRFPEEICSQILESRWWDRPVSDCIEAVDEMVLPLAKVHHHRLFVLSNGRTADVPPSQRFPDSAAPGPPSSNQVGKV